MVDQGCPWHSFDIFIKFDYRSVVTMLNHGSDFVFIFTMVYDKAWFNDMTMVLLHNHGSMTVQNLINHLIKFIRFYYLKFNLKRMIFMQLSYVYSVEVPHR